MVHKLKKIFDVIRENQFYQLFCWALESLTDLFFHLMIRLCAFYLYFSPSKENPLLLSLNNTGSGDSPHVGSVEQVTNGVSQAEPAQKAHSDGLMNVEVGPGRHVYFYYVCHCTSAVSPLQTPTHSICYNRRGKLSVIMIFTDDIAGSGLKTGG